MQQDDEKKRFAGRRSDVSEILVLKVLILGPVKQ